VPAAAADVAGLAAEMFGHRSEHQSPARY